MKDMKLQIKPIFSPGSTTLFTNDLLTDPQGLNIDDQPQESILRKLSPSNPLMLSIPNFDTSDYDTSDIDLEKYINETYELMQYYSTITFSDDDNLKQLSPFISYCEKYGSPVEDPGGQGLLLDDFKFSIAHILMFILWDKQTQLNKLCSRIVDAVTAEYNRNRHSVYYVVYTPQNQYETASSKQLNDYKFDNIAFTASTDDIYMSQNCPFPIFQIKCPYNAIVLLKSGTQKEKLRFLKEAIMENLTTILEKNPLELKIKLIDDVPTIVASTPIHLLYFLFTFLTNPDKYSVCLYCNKLLSNGNKYYQQMTT